MKYVGYTTTFVCIVFINSVINGLAFSVLWEWFIVSTFGLPVLSIPLAIGVAMTVGFLMPFKLDKEDKEDKEDKGSFGEEMFKVFLMVLAKSLMCVGYGWVILQFV